MIEQRSRSGLCDGVIRREAPETEGLVHYICVSATQIPGFIWKSHIRAISEIMSSVSSKEADVSQETVNADLKRNIESGLALCPELIEETEQFRKLILGILVQLLPHCNKLRFQVKNFHTSPSYDVISGFRV